MAKRDEFTRSWIIENALRIISRYEKGILTIRGLHYQLVSIGMTNTDRHYKRVVQGMIQARWDGLVDFDAFSDNDREMIGETDFESTDVNESIEKGKRQIQNWMKYFYKNRWENQEYYPEIFIEKKALQGVFQSVCYKNNITLGACKGYPSLTFLHEAYGRFREAERNGKKPIILYFGDYDPSGEDIPRAIQANIERMGCDVELRRIALMESQVVEMGLPPAPKKVGDSRSAKWDGLGQVELDAVKPEVLIEMCQGAIDSIFDEDKYSELMEQEESEQDYYKLKLKDFVKTL